MADDNAKLVAILSYITLIGWIIALVLYLQKKSALGGYHIRQTLLLLITWVVVWVVGTILVWIPIIGRIVGILLWVVWVLLFVLWILGLISAINEEQKPIPVIGSLAQDWFKGI